MQDGAHFPGPDPSTARRRWPGRLALVATGGLAVGVATLLAIDIGSGGPSRPQPATVPFASSAAVVHQEPTTTAASQRASTTTQTTTQTTAQPTAQVPVSAVAPTTQAPAPAHVPPTGPPARPSPAPGTNVVQINSTKISHSSASARLPDGSPLPVLAVFNGGTITLAGAVPSTAAAARLEALAAANSKIPARIIDNLVVDPAVPSSVGVRVIEMNALRFAEGSSDVTADYAPELTRVVSLMRAMPAVTALVIGHADQTGASVLNLLLSQHRATAVIDYLVSQGIGPDRLSGRGVGDRDPLTSQAGDVAMALNRRTEFVFYGLFVGLGS
jgi:outer membrane protein OmpA-like peptidoglycan-associated protein